MSLWDSGNFYLTQVTSAIHVYVYKQFWLNYVIVFQTAFQTDSSCKVDFPIMFSTGFLNLRDSGCFIIWLRSLLLYMYEQFF